MRDDSVGDGEGTSSACGECAREGFGANIQGTGSSRERASKDSGASAGPGGSTNQQGRAAHGESGSFTPECREGVASPPKGLRL